MSNEQLCPCGSKAPFATCCEPIITGTQLAETAEQLMRARFSAFATGAAAFLQKSWDPETCPGELSLDDGVEFLRLKIRDVVAGGPEDQLGQVAFTAVYRNAEGARELQSERSTFRKDSQHGWLYVDGVFE